MTQPVEAILFDMGGTLRDSIPATAEAKEENVLRIIELLGAHESPAEFSEKLTARFQEYMHWARETLVEADEAQLWTRWMLPEWTADQIAARAVELNRFWRRATGVRDPFPESRDVLIELFRRGYRLGIVSNTTSSTEVPKLLREWQLSGCFETVVLSCELGIRKPAPGILLEAARQMQIEPAQCAYIGDRLNRDVESSQKAGFAQVVVRRDPVRFARHAARHPGLVADHYIDNLQELLQIFPARRDPGVREPAYHASLSTMWARRNFPSLPDFMLASARLGFSAVEINHQVDSPMLNGMDLARSGLSSLHEPCPADISTDELKERDWLMSSPDEACRQRGVQAIYRTIDLARELGLPAIVVHCGMVSNDLTDEKLLRDLFKAGRNESEEFKQLKQRMRGFRAGRIEACFRAVKRSLQELLDYAAGSGIRLGLENRYHYYDIPNLDEMEELLAMAGPDRLGFVYDVGHAQALDRLGFIAHQDWLRRFSGRMIETHLHDVIGVDDHLAPGLGEIDFDMIASYLPEGAIRTLELQPGNSPRQVKAGLRYLHEHHCILTMEELSHAHQPAKATE